MDRASDMALRNVRDLVRQDTREFVLVARGFEQSRVHADEAVAERQPIRPSSRGDDQAVEANRFTVQTGTGDHHTRAELTHGASEQLAVDLCHLTPPPEKKPTIRCPSDSTKPADRISVMH